MLTVSDIITPDRPALTIDAPIGYYKRKVVESTDMYSVWYSRPFTYCRPS